MTDVILDIETLGTRPGCAILSIGACTFDPRGSGTGQTFYMNVDHATCREAGLYIDDNTVEWWKQQGPAAQDILLVDRRPLKDALWSFATWWQTVGGVRIWSHGANFDQPILEAAFVAAGFPGAPWSFWNSRCTRTLYAIAELDTRSAASGTKHYALDDAKAQAAAVQAAMRALFNFTTPSSNPNDGVFA